MSIESLVSKIRDLEEQLESEFEAKRAEFEYTIEKRRIVFQDEISRHHNALKTRLWKYVRGARPLIILTAPIIYAMIIPFVLLDLFVTIYQMVCFPVYGIRKVRRGDYIVLDRHKLAYLNGIEKLNCMYCSYGTGLAAFVQEIGSRTEQYWCPIKHAKRVAGAHHRYADFMEFGDADSYQEQLKTLRQKLENEE